MHDATEPTELQRLHEAATREREDLEHEYARFGESVPRDHIGIAGRAEYELLRAAFANGDLIEREKVEALVSAASALVDANTRFRSEMSCGCMDCMAVSGEPHEDGCTVVALQNTLASLTDTKGE